MSTQCNLWKTTPSQRRDIDVSWSYIFRKLNPKGNVTSPLSQVALNCRLKTSLGSTGLYNETTHSVRGMNPESQVGGVQNDLGKGHIGRKSVSCWNRYSRSSSLVFISSASLLKAIFESWEFSEKVTTEYRMISVPVHLSPCIWAWFPEYIFNLLWNFNFKLHVHVGNGHP